MSDLVGNPEDPFSHNEAHLLQDIFLLQTPGGGGYGKLDDITAEPDRKRKRTDKDTATVSTTVGRGSVYEYQRAQESV